MPLLASKDDMKQILITTIVAVLLAGTGLAGPIHDAILNENIDEVQLQLDAGTDVNEENAIGYTPLHYAAGVGRIDILELLIEHGANINATDSSNKGATPLDYAHWKGQTEVIEVLKTTSPKAFLLAPKDTPLYIEPSRNTKYASKFT